MLAGIRLMLLSRRLDPVLRDLDCKRVDQKAKYGGEFQCRMSLRKGTGLFFLDFFQMDRDGNC